jgi:hypothetical protein
MRRDKMLQAAADARIASQMPLERKRQLANIVVDNDGTLDELQAAVGALATSLTDGAWLHRYLLSPVGVTVALSAAAWCLLGR